MQNIPMLDLKREYEYMKADIDEAIAQCLDHQKWILGPEVKALEEKLAVYLNVKHCVGVSSGTDALVLSLRALAIKMKGKEFWDRDDLIITTPFTFTATGDAILRAGATPLFVDIDPETYNIDHTTILSALNNEHYGSKTVGILPVHLYGQSCQMDEIMKIAEKYNLFVLEDVAQAFGSMWKGKKLGSIGAAGTFSFFPSKNLGGFGDGGMVATNDDRIAELVRMLLRHGGKDKYNVDYIGYNARFDTLQAAIILAKCKYIDEFNEKRRQIAEKYTVALKDIEGIIVPIEHHLSPTSNPSHVFHQYTLRVLDEKRDALQVYLKKKGVSTMVYYPVPLHKMRVFSTWKSMVSGNLVNAEQAAQDVLSLPIEPLQSLEETFSVIDHVKKYCIL